MNPGPWIPIVAILGTFSVPIVAIIMDFRRRKLQFEERRAMIERGMQPPELEFDRKGRTPEERRERTLRSGVVLLCLGVGLAIAAFVLMNLVTESFLPRRMAGMAAIAAPIVGFVGLGNLIFHALSRRRGTGEGPMP